MNLDKSLLGLEFEKSFQIILERSKEDLSPLLIIRSNELVVHQNIISYLNGVKDCVYIRISWGLITWSNLDEAILGFLNSKASPRRQFWNFKKTMKVILSKREKARLTLIVIDIGHMNGIKNIFLLLGLMLELSGIIQFIFLLPDVYVNTFDSANSSFQGQIFSSLIKTKYDLR